MSFQPRAHRQLRAVSLSAFAALALGLAGCGVVPTPKIALPTLPGTGAKSDQTPHLASKPSGPAGQAGIGVNAYLWRATLDTLAFMPLSSADPFGGVVTTDWYVNPEKPNERFKATVYILDTRLRADGLNVTVFKQIKGDNGEWKDSPVAAETDTDIENAILTKARQLRLSNLNDHS